MRVFDFPTLCLGGEQNNSMNKWWKWTGAARTLKTSTNCKSAKTFSLQETEYATTAITVAKTQTYAVCHIGDVQLLKV